MGTVRICVELSEPRLQAIAFEAQRRGVPVETLVQTMVQSLLDQLETDERDGADIPIFFC